MEKLPKLTPKQAGYVLARLAGKNQVESFKTADAKNRLSPGALYVAASRMENHPKIRAHIEAGWREARSDVLLTRDKKRMVLGSIALDKSAPDTARIAAIKEDNAMTGDSKIRFEGEVTLHGIFEALQKPAALPGPAELKLVEGTDKTVTPMPAPAAEEPVLTTAMERKTG